MNLTRQLANVLKTYLREFERAKIDGDPVRIAKFGELIRAFAQEIPAKEPTDIKITRVIVDIVDPKNIDAPTRTLDAAPEQRELPPATSTLDTPAAATEDTTTPATDAPIDFSDPRVVGTSVSLLPNGVRLVRPVYRDDKATAEMLAGIARSKRDGLW